MNAHAYPTPAKRLERSTCAAPDLAGFRVVAPGVGIQDGRWTDYVVDTISG